MIQFDKSNKAVLFILSTLCFSNMQAQQASDTTKKQKQLQEFILTDSRSVNEEPLNTGKIAIRPMDLPQSTAVVDRDVLTRQQVLHIGEALQNVNGLYIMGTSGGVQEEIAGRGYAFTSANTFKNGVRFNNAAMPEVTGVERMEVLKGSAAILYGNVAAGGVLNIITKKPKFETGGEVSLRLGSYDLYKPSFDVYGAINNSKHVAYRLNGSYEKAGSFRDQVSSERFYVNPSLLFKINERLDVLVEGDYLKDDRTSDFGTGAVNYEVADVPRNRFLGASWSYYKTEQQSATVTTTYRLNPNWQISNKTGCQSFGSDLFGTTRPNASGNLVAVNGDWARKLQRTEIDEQYYVTQLDLTGVFYTGSMKHQFLVGADADKYKTRTTAYASPNYDTINIYDPGKFVQRNDIPTVGRSTVTDAPVDRAGVYIQDLVSLTKQIKLLAGVRYSYQQTESNLYTVATEKTATTTMFDGAWTPRLGLVYQPLKTVSVFASYANSFVLNTGTDINNKALAPSLIDQYEAGVKTDLLKGFLSANLTAYQIVNSNLAQTSAVDATKKELAGEVTSRGIELDLMSKSYCGFSIIAGYSFNETKYTKSNTYITGSKLRYNPAHTANANIYYQFCGNSFLKGFNLSAGAYYVGERAAGRSTRINLGKEDTYKLMPVPDFVLFDASVGYTVDRLSVRLKMTNIADKLSYYVHDDNSVNPIAPRQVAATISYRF